MTLSLTNTLGLVGASEIRATRDAFDYVSLTSAQQEFVDRDDPALLWRDGNQLGKSYALAWWVLSIILQRNRAFRRRAPNRILVVSYSMEQMIPLMAKLWELSPKHVPGRAWKRGKVPRLKPSCGFESARGVTGQPPRLVFEDGSEIVFATYKQGSARIAGGTFDAVVMDEPPPESVYGEVLPRILRKRGILRIVMTPVPDMPDMEWLWEKVDGKDDVSPTLSEINFGLCEDILIPQGWPKPWLLQEDIDAYAASLLEVERAMRIDGARHPLITGRWLKAFEEATHAITVPRDAIRGAYLVGSFDHGTVEGKQVFSLQAYKGRTTDRPKCWILDEEINEGITTPEHDAQAALDVLERHGMAYDDVDAWVGDVPASSRKFEIKKSNRALRKEMARLLGRKVATLKKIEDPRKHAGSLSYGMRTINTMLERGDLMVDRRCVGFIEGAKTFRGDTRDPFKDPLDAARYGIEHACTGRVLTTLNARY